MEPERRPRVAVIVPCHDDGPLVVGAVASVRGPEPVEVVVVDDASRDEETLSALRELEAGGVRVLRRAPGAGPAAARMAGLAATTAPFVYPLDADDLAEPGALASMADRLEADPGAAACVGDIAEFGDHALVRAVPARLDPYRVAFTNEYPITALFRRTTLEAVGGWTVGDPIGYEDWGLWMTLAERGERIVHLGAGRCGYRRRVHGARLNAAAKGRHALLYRRLRRRHPRLFAELGLHRRRSDLSRPRRLLYPLLYGERARWPFEERLKPWLDRSGVWTRRRRGRAAGQ